MDIFLHQHINSLQKAVINPPEPRGTLFFMMDGCDLFNLKKNQQAFIADLNIGKLGHFFFKYNSKNLALQWKPDQFHL